MNKQKLYNDTIAYISENNLSYLSAPVDLVQFGAEWAMKNIWISIEDGSNLGNIPLFVDVIGYNKEWINEWNPNGTRIGYFSTENDSGEFEFHSAVYQSDSEDYGNCRSEGDDYDACQEQPDGTTKTWYNNDGNDVEGHRPNMPTHYMFIPDHP